MTASHATGTNKESHRMGAFVAGFFSSGGQDGHSSSADEIAGSGRTSPRPNT